MNYFIKILLNLIMDADPPKKVCKCKNGACCKCAPVRRIMN